MAIETQKYMDDLDLFEKKIGIIVGAKTKNRDKIANSIKMQDSIRLKIKHWDGFKEIIKWRQKRN